jgi:hypothetical protein
MSALAVVTPSWLPDRELFDDLHRSVLEFTPGDTVHHVIVPWMHRAAFARYESSRCRVWTHQDLIPRRYWRLPGGLWLNARQPWPPVRGWVMQQAIKLVATSQMEADIALLIDSDVALVRPVTADLVTAGGKVVLHRDEVGVHTTMSRHVLWHQVARELLGLPPAPEPPLPDYVSPLGIWEPATARALQERIQQVTGKHWLDAFTGQMHISEFIVYGVFVDQVLHANGSRPPSSMALCHNSWVRAPMDEDAALAFADELSPEAVAIMISSHSRTSRAVREIAQRRSAQRTDR